MSDITSMLRSFWHIFTDLQVPLLGISFATLWIGIFAVSISIKILMPLIGLGGNVPKSAIKSRIRRKEKTNDQHN